MGMKKIGAPSSPTFSKRTKIKMKQRLCTGWGTLEIDWAIKESGGQTTQRISRSLPPSRYPSATWNFPVSEVHSHATFLFRQQESLKCKNISVLIEMLKIDPPF